jgi:hypothetical protein
MNMRIYIYIRIWNVHRADVDELNNLNSIRMYEECESFTASSCLIVCVSVTLQKYLYAEQTFRIRWNRLMDSVYRPVTEP